MVSLYLTPNEVKHLMLKIPKSLGVTSPVPFTINENELCAIKGKKDCWVVWTKDAFYKHAANSTEKKKKVVADMYLAELEKKYSILIEEKENSSK